MSRHFSGRYLSRTRKTDLADGDPDRLYFNQITSHLNTSAHSVLSSHKP
jgi:hypothetical protein